MEANSDRALCVHHSSQLDYVGCVSVRASAPFPSMSDMAMYHQSSLGGVDYRHHFSSMLTIATESKGEKRTTGEEILAFFLHGVVAVVCGLILADLISDGIV